MKLSEYLLDQDVAQLREIAGLYACECNRNSKLDLVQSIHFQMFDNRHYAHLLGELEQELLYFMTYLLFQSRSCFSLDELVAQGNLLQSLFDFAGSPRQWVARLLQKGWLFSVSTKFQIQLEVPEDYRPFLQRQFIRFWQRRSGLPAEEPTELTVRDEEDAFVYDLQTWLRFVAPKPLPLTKEGVLHKRCQRQLLNKLHVAEDLVDGRQWRFGYGRRFPYYPNRFALIYDFSYNNGWIREEQNVVHLTAKGFEALAEETLVSAEQRKACLHYWLRTYKRPIPTLPFLVHWMGAVFLQQWVSTDKLFEVLSPWLQPFYYDDVPTIFRERMIQMLLHLGVIQIGIDSQTAQHYVMKKDGSFFR